MATRKNYLDVTQKADKSIWVVIPVRNEEASLPLVLRELPTVSRIIIADNGSTDHSRQVAEDFGAQVVYEPEPGYGKACLAGLAEISRRINAGETAPEIVVFIDGDYSDFPEYLTQLVEPILNGSQDFVLGSRLMGEREPGAMPPQSIYGNMLACGLMRLFWGTRYTDLGPFRAISWRALESLRMEDQNFGWTVEMQIKAAIAKLRILELPVPYRKRVGVSKISGTISGTFRAAYKILWTIGKYAWLMRGWSPQIADGRKPSCEYMELSTHTQDGSRRAAKWLFIGRRCLSDSDGSVLLVEKQMSRYTTIAVVAVIVVAITVCGGVLVLRGARVPRSERDVPEITATELRQRQRGFEARLQQARLKGFQEPISDFILVDVRSPEETKVSVIPHALTVEQFESKSDSFRERTVICYCTVGVRSEKFAQSLRHDGFNALNLKGSIVEWCKQHYPLVDLDGHSTRQVHTWSDAYCVPSDYEAVW